jgi:hypothetical protein
MDAASLHWSWNNVSLAVAVVFLRCNMASKTPEFNPVALMLEHLTTHETLLITSAPSQVQAHGPE